MPRKKTPAPPANPVERYYHVSQTQLSFARHFRLNAEQELRQFRENLETRSRDRREKLDRELCEQRERMDRELCELRERLKGNLP